jgi:DNA-binding NtrC family response regulator
MRTYPLPQGQVAIGSIAGNTVVLPVRGVSRRHARLTVSGRELVLEDLGSRNGTRANGTRVERTHLQPGDEVRIGPVTLRVEEIDADDVELAVRALVEEAASGLSASHATAQSPDDCGIVMTIAEGFLARMSTRPRPDLNAAVAFLKSQLGARGAGVFEMLRAEPVTVAADGELPDLAGREDLRDFVLARDHVPAGAIVARTFGGQPPLCCAVVSGAGGERLGLAAWGELRTAPADTEALLQLLLGVTARFRARPLTTAVAAATSRAGLVFPEGYVRGQSPGMAALYAQMELLLQGDVPVLLLGETGVGKEHLAHTLHASSARRSKPFVAVNCAAIPAELLESEMFGIARGVASGVAERPGKFQLADGGTLLLDEVGDMPLPLQAKLLRALQEKEVQPVGGAATPVDVRVVTATNSDLQRRIEEGLFRRDLYYRVAGFTLRVPPLRERKEDVLALVEGFLAQFTREMGKELRGVTVKALRVLTEYAWPGNVRELQHEIRRLVYLCPAGEAIDSSMLSEHIAAAPAGRPPDGPPSLQLEPNVDALERRLISEALARAGGNRTQAARLLGLSRNGLANKMERLGIHG